ncbi:MAG TPA: DNA import protein CedA1 [Sulfolobales archaeon]|nr:DNA import protein CedA1 [Sulfolobales archaeon]
MDLVSFVRQLTVQVMVVAWGIFILTWIVGWALRGSPIPLTRIKKTGNSLIEDAVWAAFWLAMGGTVFSLITYIVSQIGIPAPPPPVNTTIGG